MITLIVTGGIATGKSTFCSLFRARWPEAAFFDSDGAVHELLTTRIIIDNIVSEFGKRVLEKNGQLNRSIIREIVFAGQSERRALESILHPEVRRICLERREAAEASARCPVFLADVPLFFESDFPLTHDYSIVVATSSETQKRRLMTRSPMAADLAERIIGAQWPIGDKVRRADIVAWNEGELGSLGSQIQYLKEWLQTKKL